MPKELMRSRLRHLQSGLNIEFDPLLDRAFMYASHAIPLSVLMSSLSSLLTSVPCLAGLPLGDLLLSLLRPGPGDRRGRLEANAVDPIAVIAGIRRVVACDLRIMPDERVL